MMKKTDCACVHYDKFVCANERYQREALEPGGMSNFEFDPCDCSCHDDCDDDDDPMNGNREMNEAKELIDVLERAAQRARDYAKDHEILCRWEITPIGMRIVMARPGRSYVGYVGWLDLLSRNPDFVLEGKERKGLKEIQEDDKDDPL